MNHYIIWFNLKNTQKAHNFIEDLNHFISYLKEKSLIVNHQILRRKFGFGPQNLGEFQLNLICKDLQQLDDAFHKVIKGMREDNELEVFHRTVYSQIKDMQTALYRDFPD